MGDASWMVSPANLSLKDGLPKKISHALVVAYFSSSLLVDGTCFVKKMDVFLRPKLTTTGRVGKQKYIDDELSMYAPASATGGDLEKGLKGSGGSARSGKSSTRSSKQDTDDDWSEPKSTASPLVESSWWLLWSTLTMLATFVVVRAVGTLDDVVRIVAALIACQTTITWPSLLFYQLYERSKRRSEDCYYHGSGTAPCHCSRRYRILSPRVLLLALGVFLGIFGVWGNSVDLAAYWKQNKKSFELFGCRKTRNHAVRALASGRPLIFET